MCQSSSQGGRRCPIHQKANRAAIKTAAVNSGLTIYQVERLFAELRREGRNSPLLTETQQEDSYITIRAISETNNITEDVEQLLSQTGEDTNLDGASGYAQRLIIERAKTRSEALNQRFETIAERTGYLPEEVAEKFDEIYNGIEIRRGEENPPEYTPTARRHAAQANLPYDVQSVVALERLNNIEQQQNERRVELLPVPNSDLIHSFGYDEGRLEVTFNNNPEQVFAYHNIPESVWEDLRSASSVGYHYYRYIRGNEDYIYNSAEEAERDAFRIRCASCGQFRASDHSCPERVKRENSSTSVSVSATSDETNRNDEQQTIIPDNNEPVALPELPVVDVWKLEEEPSIVDEVNEERKALVVNENIERLNYVPTAENQRLPSSYDAVNKLLVYTHDVKIKEPIVIPGGMNLSGATTLSSEERQIIENAPEHINFVVEKNRTPEGMKSQIIKSYDNRKYFSDLKWNSSVNNQGLYVSVADLKIFRHGKKAETSKTVTLEDQVDAANFIEKMVEEDKAVRVPSTATASRKFVFDSNLNEQPKIKTGNSAAFKKAIKEGKAVALPIYIENTGYNVQLGVDDQGYNTQLYTNIIAGEVLVRRNTAGVMEVVSDERSLKCSCRDYRDKYYCSHLNYAQRHIGNVAQQLVPIPTAPNRVVNNPDASPAERLLTPTLAARNDVSIVEPEKGDPYVSFVVSANSPVGNIVKKEFSDVFNNRLIVPNEYLPVDSDNPTTAEIIALTAYYNAMRSAYFIKTPRSPSSIRAALKRSDVELPFSLIMYGNTSSVGEGGDVKGNILYNKQVDGKVENATVKSHTLKCTCGDYRRDYDCIHVRAVLSNPLLVLGAGSRMDAEGRNIMSRVRSRYSDLINRENELKNILRINRDFTREQAIERYDTIREQAARAEEARRLEYQRLELERQENFVIQRRARLEEIKEENKPTIEDAVKYRENMMKRWETVDEGYSANPEMFFNAYTEAIARKNKGKSVIPFRTENVTDGICADTPGARRFGVELEFDIKTGVDKERALRKIGEELKEAGLTDNSRQQQYHAAQSNGWSKWSLEHDQTVAAELVSPIMKDTPEDWKQLETAIEIINRNGGVASTRTGSHVHVSTASYESSTAKHIELLRQVNQNEDILYRLASNPKRGIHRGTQWCEPNVNDSYGDIDQEHILGGLSRSHGVALNFESSMNEEYKKSNVEFRMWDGTLDAAVIQQQVVLSAAITDAAEREVIKNGKSKKPTKDRLKIGTGKEREAEALSELDDSNKHTLDSFNDTNSDVANFFDSILRRSEDRNLMTALFAITNWQKY